VLHFSPTFATASALRAGAMGSVNSPRHG